VYVPHAAREGKKMPLVFDLHGSGGNGRQQAALSDLASVAERRGFVVADPDGGIALTDRPGAFVWHLPGLPLIGNVPEPADAPDEVQFVSDTIDQLASSSCIDASRVYVTGMSGGARMASWLACRLADRIAAVAPVAGLRAGTPLASDPTRPDPESCRPNRAMPIITFHAVHDPVNPYGGGGAGYWGYGVEAALSRWLEIDRCNLEPKITRVSAHVTERRYQCAAGVEVLFYRNDAPLELGGGHVWPRSKGHSGPPEIDASDLMWQFFDRHRVQR
jgi:polyhydroxybutyrate depolymerase